MFCSKCGTQLNDGFDFCNSCGAKQETQSLPLTQIPKSNAKSLINKAGIIFLCSGFALAIIVSVIDLIGYGRVYMFESGAYLMTKISWVAAFVCVALGIFFLCIKKSNINALLKPKKKFITIIAGVIILLIAITSISIAIANRGPSLEERLKDAKNDVQNAENTYQNAQDKLDRIKELQVKYNEIQRRINSLPEGSSARAAAVEENNQLVRQILREFPEMAPYVKEVN